MLGYEMSYYVVISLLMNSVIASCCHSPERPYMSALTDTECTYTGWARLLVALVCPYFFHLNCDSRLYVGVL